MKAWSVGPGNLQFRVDHHRALKTGSIVWGRPWAALWLLFVVTLNPAFAQIADNHVQRVMLPDQAHLILKPEQATDVVALTVMVRMPADTDPLDTATGELVSRSLFFGSMNTTFELIARSVARVGGDLTTLRTPDYVAFSCVTVPEQLPQAIYLLCESLKNAEFAPEALERARGSYQDEVRQRKAHPFDVAYEMCAGGLRGVVTPDPELFSRVTQQRAQIYFRKRYVSNRTIISVVGHFEPQSVRRQFEDQLVDYNRAPPRFPAFPPAVRIATDDRRPKMLNIIGDTAYALVGVRAPIVDSPDYPAYTVLQALLGGGHAARLFRRVRDAQGIGYEVGTLYKPDLSDPLVAYIQWDLRRNVAALTKPADALTLLNAQLDAVLTDLPTEAEVARARNVAIGRDALRHERAQERAFLLAWYETMGVRYTYDADFPTRLGAVTRDDVLRVARTYLSTRTDVLAAPTDH